MTDYELAQADLKLDVAEHAMRDAVELVGAFEGVNFKEEMFATIGRLIKVLR